MKKRVFVSVPLLESFGTSWHKKVIVRASLNELLEVFSLSYRSVKRNLLTDKTRYELCLKTDGLPCFTLYDRCVFPYARQCYNEFDVVIDWHLGTFNDDVCIRTCKCLKKLGVDIVGCFFHEDYLPFEDDLPF